MSRIARLGQQIQALEEQLVVCMRCGMCQAVCPLFAETGREADVARGKLALLDGLMNQVFDDPSGAAERLNRCLLCGSCAANCPSGVNVLEIFIQARAILADIQGLPMAKRMILRGLLARPALFDGLTAMAAKMQFLGVRKANPVIGTSCTRVPLPVIGPRHFKSLAATPFHQRELPRDTAPATGKLKVAFFVGCLADKLFTDLADDVLMVLDHHKMGVYMPAGQGCCGIPAVASGDLKTFETLMAHNLERFAPHRFDVLVTPCASCTSTIKKIWPEMSKENTDLHKAATRLADKAMDISEFLVKHCQVRPLAETDETAPVVTYHDPCHLKKSLGISAEPRQVIDAAGTHRRVEMRAPDRCCGMGGSFNLQYYGLSSSIGARKREDIAQSGAEVVATSCPACMLQIGDMLSQAGDPIAVRHPVQLYADALRAHVPVSADRQGAANQR